MEVYQKHSSTAGYLFCQNISIFDIPPDKLHIVMGLYVRIIFGAIRQQPFMVLILLNRSSNFFDLASSGFIAKILRQ